MEEESRLNSILMLRDCVGERLTLEVVLRYGSCKLVNTTSFDCKIPFMFLQKNDSLSELGHQRFIAFLVAHWVCYRIVTVRGFAYGEGHRLEFCGGMCYEVRQGKPRVAVASYQNQLVLYILNIDATFRNQKL